jgi:hypothetical protein
MGDEEVVAVAAAVWEVGSGGRGSSDGEAVVVKMDGASMGAKCCFGYTGARERGCLCVFGCVGGGVRAATSEVG